jgi:hypothetical protein
MELGALQQRHRKVDVAGDSVDLDPGKITEDRAGPRRRPLVELRDTTYVVAGVAEVFHDPGRQNRGFVRHLEEVEPRTDFSVELASRGAAICAFCGLAHTAGKYAEIASPTRGQAEAAGVVRGTGDVIGPKSST